MATLTPTASAMHEQYVKTYNKWLKQHYPDQYGNWLNKGPKRRFIGKWGSRFGALGFLYEGLKEVFDTGDIPTTIEEREKYRANVINQHYIDITPQIIYKDGLAVGFEAPKGSDVDLSRYVPYQAAKVYDEPQIPETDGETLEWIDPMDEWWPINDEHVYTKDAIREANDTGFISKTANAAKNMYDTAKYYTPPEIRQKVAETASFVSGGAYKLKD
jgi:hypothetical protein